MIQACVCEEEGRGRGRGGGGRGGGDGVCLASVSGPMCMFVFVIRVTASKDKNKVLKSWKRFYCIFVESLQVGCVAASEILAVVVYCVTAYCTMRFHCNASVLCLSLLKEDSVSVVVSESCVSLVGFYKNQVWLHVSLSSKEAWLQWQWDVLVFTRTKFDCGGSVLCLSICCRSACGRLVLPLLSAWRRLIVGRDQGPLQTCRGKGGQREAPAHFEVSLPSLQTSALQKAADIRRAQGGYGWSSFHVMVGSRPCGML